MTAFAVTSGALAGMCAVVLVSRVYRTIRAALARTARTGERS
jgi:hypothetical protein